jgi:hypothetical protein
MGWQPEVGIGIAWAIAGTMALVGVAVGRRLPGPSEPEERASVAAEDGVLPHR